MATAGNVQLSISDQPDSDGNVEVHVTWEILGGEDDHKDGTMYRERVELVAVDRGVGEPSSISDPIIHPMAPGLPLWEGYHTFTWGEPPAPVRHEITVPLKPGILNEDTSPLSPRGDDEIMARVVLISVGLSNIVVRKAPSGPQVLSPPPAPLSPT